MVVLFIMLTKLVEFSYILIHMCSYETEYILRKHVGGVPAPLGFHLGNKNERVEWNIIIN